MKKILFLLLIVLSSSISAIESNEYNTRSSSLLTPKEDIKTLFKEEQYQQIIDRYAPLSNTLSAEELMYVAQSYMNLGDSQNGLKFTNMAFEKDKEDTRIYFVMGVLYNIQGEYDKAIKNLEEAIRRAPKEANYYTALGDSYYGLENFDAALTNYTKATSLNPPSEKAFFMIASTYASQNKEKEALDAFNIAKLKIKSDKELFVTVLYNIGKIEFDNGAYDKAAEAYNELITYFPDDYYSYEKLIQCYNASGQYAKADKTKETLYKAYNKGLLAKTSISDEFCIDQFAVGSKEVLAYERYQDESSNAFLKNVFYVINPSGDVEYSIYMEDTPAEGGKRVYKLSRIEDSTHYTFNIEFDNNISYHTIKPYIIDIINGKIKPN